MTYQRVDRGSDTYLFVRGELDALSAPRLRVIIDKIVTDGRTSIVVDVSGLDMIDSSGVATLVLLLKRTSSLGGRVALRGARDQPRAIFELMRMERLFQTLEAGEDSSSHAL